MAYYDEDDEDQDQDLQIDEATGLDEDLDD
jgi:hypothetical protein